MGTGGIYFEANRYAKEEHVMQLPKQTANVRREVVEIPYGAAASPTMKQGIKPLSSGSSGGPPPPPPDNPRSCARTCGDCPVGLSCGSSSYCRNRYPDLPWGCY